MKKSVARFESEATNPQVRLRKLFDFNEEISSSAHPNRTAVRRHVRVIFLKCVFDDVGGHIQSSRL
jgi:hypothetical protein